MRGSLKRMGEPDAFVTTVLYMRKIRRMGKSYSVYIHEVCKLDRASSAIRHIAMCHC